jgi:LPS-assembly lipoprotein
MSSCDRRSLIGLLAALPLAACGFSPVYSPGGPAAAIRGRVRPDDPTDRLAYEFVARFEDRMGRAGGAPWALGYTIETREVGTGLNPDNVATRITLQGAADWSVRPASGGDPVLSGRVESFTAFSATGSTTATLTARRDAEDRLMVILADQLVAQLAAQAAALSP